MTLHFNGGANIERKVEEMDGLQPNIYADPEVDKHLLKHNNRPMKALYWALQNTFHNGIAQPMSIIMDQRCGIERRAEEADGFRNIVGATPLILAISAGRLDVANALLAAGADQSAKDANGYSSLIVATHKGNLKVIESLIDYGADINAVDGNGNTSLHNATISGHTSIIELLDRSGANLEAVQYQGRTPLHDAASSGAVGVINANKAGTIKSLLTLGAKQAAVDNEGRTPLHCAAASKYARAEDIVAFQFNVAAFEANVTAVDKYGHTPLQVYKPHAVFEDSKARALLTPK